MPLATLHLLQLNTDAPKLVSELKQDASIKIILWSLPQFHVIRPQTLDVDTLNQSWDLLLLLTSSDKTNPTPDLSKYKSQIKNAYTLTVGIPSRILDTYPSRNTKLLSNVSHANKNLTGALEQAEMATKSSSQNLELSPELLSFMQDFTDKYGYNQPVTMLNLLHFTPPNGKASYANYGKAFVKVAGKRGGDAKLVGNVVPGPQAAGEDGDSRAGRTEQQWWNEFSLVHYPSIRAFCDMLAGEDYQEINRKHRLGALKDTLLICTREPGTEDKAKL